MKTTSEKTSIAKRKTRALVLREGSRARRERQKEALRETILETASALFFERGYDGFSLRLVAQKIGYSPTTIYLYFKDKDDLILACAQDGFARFDAHLSAHAARHDDALERIRALGKAYIEFGIANAALYRLMFMQRDDQFVLPRLDDEFSGETPRVLARALLVEAVRDGQKSGQIRRDDAVEIADVLWIGAHGLTSLALDAIDGPKHSATNHQAFARYADSRHYGVNVLNLNPASTCRALSLSSLVNSVNPRRFVYRSR